MKWLTRETILVFLGCVLTVAIYGVLYVHGLVPNPEKSRKEMDPKGVACLLAVAAAVFGVGYAVCAMLSIRRRLKVAIQRGDVEKVRSLLARRPAIHQFVALFALAVRLGDGAIIEELRRYAHDTSGGAEAGTALQLAAAVGLTEAIEAQVKRGADVNERDGDLTPLHHAVQSHVPSAVAVLLRLGADVNVESREGATPLHHAAELWNPQIAELLLRHGANPSATDEFGETPLHYAATGGNLETAELLLEYGADLTIEGMAGTAATAAEKAGIPKMAEFLRQYGKGPAIRHSLP